VLSTKGYGGAMADLVADSLLATATWQWRIRFHMTAHSSHVGCRGVAVQSSHGGNFRLRGTMLKEEEASISMMQPDRTT